MECIETKNSNRVKNMKRVNTMRRAKSDAIVFFLRVIDNIGNLKEVMLTYHLKCLSIEQRTELFNTFSKLNYMDTDDDIRHYLNSYRADKILQMLGLNFNKNKLKMFSTNGNRSQNKELTQLVLSVIKNDVIAYRAALDLFIKYWIFDYELREKKDI